MDVELIPSCESSLVNGYRLRCDEPASEMVTPGWEVVKIREGLPLGEGM